MWYHSPFYACDCSIQAGKGHAMTTTLLEESIGRRTHSALAWLLSR
jgi:hypothetical protein